MSRRRRPAAADLVAACTMGFAGSLVAAFSPGGWLQLWLSGLFVLATTGYAIGAALFPPGTLEREDRWIYSFVLSVSAAALGGLAFQLLVDLSRGAWAAIAMSITLCASAVAWRRRFQPQLDEARRTPARPQAGVLWAITFLAALTIGGVAIAVAAGGVHEQQSRQRFASLWAVPGDGRIEAGVWNHGGPARYRLEVRSDGKPIESLRLRLAPDQHWRVLLGPAASESDSDVLITLYHGRIPYRSVELRPASLG